MHVRYTYSTFLNCSTCCTLKIHNGTVLIRMLVFFIFPFSSSVSLVCFKFERFQWIIVRSSWHRCTAALLCVLDVTFTTWCCCCCCWWCWTHFPNFIRMYCTLYSVHPKFKNHYVSVVNFLSWKRNEFIPSAYFLLAGNLYTFTYTECKHTPKSSRRSHSNATGCITQQQEQQQQK